MLKSLSYFFPTCFTYWFSQCILYQTSLSPVSGYIIEKRELIHFFNNASFIGSMFYYVSLSILHFCKILLLPFIYRIINASSKTDKFPKSIVIQLNAYGYVQFLQESQYFSLKGLLNKNFEFIPMNFS